MLAIHWDSDSIIDGACTRRGSQRMDTTEKTRQINDMATHGRRFRANTKYRRSGFSRHLWKTTALSTLALALSGIAAHAGDTGLWQPQVRAIIGANNNGGNTAIEGFLPLKQNLESVLFLDVRSKYDFDDGFGQDVGLGVRRIVNPDLMIGGYAYLNIQNQDSHQFVASTLGLEAITSKYDAHVNVYLPISGDRSTAGQESSLSLVGHQLIEQISAIAHRDYAAWGIEGEVGVQVPLNLPENHSLRFDVGAYHFGDPDGDDGSITGAKAGLEYSIGDVIGKGTSLTFTGEVRNDNRDDTQFAGSIRLTVPLNAFDKGSSSADDGAEPVYPVSPGLRKRVNERVRGDIGVRIESQDKVTGTSTRVAINAATNTAFGQFFFADGDNDALGLGTIGDPTTLDNAVAGAGANGLVVALGGKGNITTAGVTLANGQTVIGGGGGVQARLADGSIGTYNFGGSNGTIQGTNPANNVLTLANGNTLSGITITGGKDGIFGNNIAGATLTNVTVTGTGGHGADFTGTSTGVNGSNFTATGNGLDGLYIEGDGTYNFTGTTLLQGNGDDGLDITGHGTYTFATLNALDNNDAGITVKGTGVAGSITITGGQVSGNKALGDDGVGVFIDPITAHIVLDSITQTGGASGVVLENLSGSFTVNGATTISNTTGPAIAITESPAAIRFGDINITNPGSDGMVFAGANTSIIAGNIVIAGLGSGVGLDFSGSQTNFRAQSLNITGTGAAGSIGIDLSSPSAGGATIVITDGGAIANVDTGVRFGISGSLANSANAQFSFGGGSIAGITASLDARGLNQTLGLYAFGSTTFSGPQLFDQQNVIFVGGVGSLGDGSSTSSLLAINQADLITNGTAIFVLVNDGTPIDASGGFSLSAGQTMASFGNGRTFSLGGIPVNVTGDNVKHDQAVSDPGGAATLTNTGTGDAVTLANNTSLLDFNIAGVANGNGVHGSGVSNVTMSGLNVSGASLNGVLFDAAINNVSADNLNSSGNTGSGLLIDNGGGTYSFTGTTTLSNNTGHGLFIVSGGNYGFETLDAKDNGGLGIFVNSTGGGSLTTTGGTVSGNGLQAVYVVTFGLINPMALNVTLDTVSQSGGQSGIGLGNVGGNFSVTGTTTTSNTLFDGIFITNSAATVDFGGAATITQPSRDGISINNSSGATTFGTVTINQAGVNGILLNGNSGAVTFGDASIGQPTQSGIDVQGANGTISFANIDITGLPTGKTGLDLSGSQSTFTATSLDIAGAGTSTGIDLSGTTGGSVTIGTGVISAGTGVQMGTNGAAGTGANTTFSFGAGVGTSSITGTTASLDMRGLLAGNGTYAFNATHLVGPQLFDTANVIFVGAANTGTGSGASVGDLINADAADGLTTDANTIFVLVNNGAGTINTDADGFTLADGQQIVSFANGNTVALGGPPANVTGAEVVTSGTQVDPFGNGAATLNNSAGSTIDLANGNRVADLSVSNAGSGSAINGSNLNAATITGVTISSAVTGIDLTGATGAINITNTTMGGVSGTGLLASNFGDTGTFNNLDITGAGIGVSVTGGSTGTLTFDNASSIAGTTGTALSILGATPNLTYNGTINQTSAASAVMISGMTGGSATFAGQITASTGAANAIDLTGNAGGTINFTGGLDLTTDGGLAFSAINGGTLTVTGTNTTASGLGPVENGIHLGGAGGLTIGAGGVIFDSVTVDGSGGAVQTGILIENTSGGSVTFGAVDINRVNGDAIRLTNVANAVTFNGTTTIDTVVGGGPGFGVQGSAATVNVNNLVTTLVSGDDVSLTNNTGTINIGGTITGSGTGNGVVVFGGSAAITVSANISSSATAPGTAVKIDGTIGGSAQFSGSVTSTGTGNLFAIGSTLPPAGGAFSFTGPTLSASGGGGAVVGGLIGTATLNVTTPLSITNALGTGLSVFGVASTASATFGAVTVTGAGGFGINIVGNAGPVTFGTTQVTLGTTSGTAGINFAGTNNDVSFGTTTIDDVGANQTGIDFSGSSTTADFGLTTITGLGDLTSRGIDLSSATGNKVITFLQGSKIDNVGIGVELSSGQTTATSANANFTFGDGDSTDGLESFIIAAAGGFTVNTVGLDPTLGNYDFDDVFFTGSANLATAPGSITLVSQSGGFIAAGTTGNLSMGVNTISLAAADALTGTQNFAFVGTINLGATAFTLDSGQTITGFGNSNVVSTGTIQPANVQGNLGAIGGNITGDEAVVSGTANLMQLLGDNAVRHTAFDFSSATGAAFLIDQSAVGFSNASGITIEGVTISNVAAGQTAIQVAGLNGNLSIINNNINVAGTLLDVNGGTGTISVSRGILPNSATPGTLTGGGINIANRTGGAVTFTDQVTITGGNGVSISGGSAAAAVNFNGGLDITTSLATGLSLSGLNGLTVANAGSTTINATGQTALSLQGTLGAGGVNFDSITSSGATSGIILNGVTGAVNVSGATSITGTGSFGIDVTGANTGTFNFNTVTVNNVATTGGGINWVSGNLNIAGLANIDTSSGVGFSQSAGTVNFLNGLTIDTTSGTGIVGTGGVMGITASAAAQTVNSTSGQSISLTNVAASIALDSTSSGGGTNNVGLANVTGTVSLGSGALSGASGVAFLVNGGAATVSYGGSVTKTTAGKIVDISGVTGGSVTLSGALSATGGFDNGIYVHGNSGGTITLSGGTKTLTTGANTAVDLTTNTGATINFDTGGLVITTTSGTGFNASGGGTVSVGALLSDNSITTTAGGTALNLNGVTIGAAGMNFDSVSATAAATGISLTNIASSGGGAIILGTVNLQGMTTRGVDVSGTLGAALSFNDLDIGLNSTTGVAFDLNGATINAAVTANDFDVTNAAAAGTSIAVDLRGAIGGQTVRLGDAVVGGASSSIAGVNTGVFLNSATNLAFTYGDGESATDQLSTIGANVGIDASSAPVAGTYNFQDVNFQSTPGLGFGVGKVYFVGASATGDGSGRDQNNLATLTTAEAAAVSTDILVLVNDGGVITAAGSNGNDTLALAIGEQVRGFGNGNINLALTVPSTIQLASNSISIIDQTPNGAATLTTSAGNNVITLGASGNIIDGFILDGSPAGAARGVKDNGAGAANTVISNMTIRNFATQGIEITPSNSTKINNVAFSGNASDVWLNASNSTITNVTSTGATGIAFKLDNTAGTTTLTNVNITTAATGTGIAFGGASGAGGTIAGTNVDISGGSGLSVTGGNAVISFDGASSIISTSGAAATISTRAGGSFTFAGSVIANGAASGISISGATAANTVSFTGTVDLGTTTPTRRWRGSETTASRSSPAMQPVRAFLPPPIRRGPNA
ncbi:inverse autotransporter beta domain-containing protein [Mesorhizobium sp. L2C066B000]|uniref:inverse autotransporter beta domain-containing protein n=1 Tax=Mesorhizobium sp. L2C066B000 TaxID=1287105 RepID=UPI0032AFB667